MQKKCLSISLVVVVCLSLFAVLNVLPVKASPEDDLYYYASQLTVKVYRDGQYWETRDFKYKTSWYACKLLFNAGRRMGAIIKFYKTPLREYNASWNTAQFAIYGMEDDYYGGDSSFSDAVLQIGADYADNGQKLIFIDCLFVVGLYKEVFYQGNMILNSSSVKTSCTILGWAFYDNEYPDYPYPNGGYGGGNVESESSDIVNYPFPSVKDCAENVASQILARNGTYWNELAWRKWLENPSDNANKWWLKYLHYEFKDRSTDRYEILLVGIEDLWLPDCLGDSYADILVQFVWYWNKVTGAQKYEYTFCFLTGGFSIKLYYKLGADPLREIFGGWQGDPIGYRLNYVISQW